MADEADFLEGVSDQRVTLSVSPGQLQQLAGDQLRPGAVRVTHKIAIGPFYLPGVYVVVGTYHDTLGGPNSDTITLARLVD
jgi:Flp pilus assembly protein CpaB